jgi:hypothetical protein
MDSYGFASLTDGWFEVVMMIIQFIILFNRYSFGLLVGWLVC